jgi:hypothetical protein
MQHPSADLVAVELEPRRSLDLARPTPKVRLCAEGPAFLVEQLRSHYRDELDTRRLRAVQVS